MKIVNLDAYTISLENQDSWRDLELLGNLITYQRTAQNLVVEAIDDDGSDDIAIFTSKCKITEDVMARCPHLRFIGITATGYDNVDILAAKARNIAVCNIPAYSTESVAQHTMSLILEISNNVGLYSISVHGGKWATSPDFCYYEKPIFELFGRSLGIIGYGNIGKRVGQLAEAFGMTVNVYSRNMEAALKSDFITLHCPLTAENKGFINDDFISKMKDGAVLINTARGALINEEALVNNLLSGKLSAAAVDVVCGEPPASNHPFIGVPNLYITPHIAWSSENARDTICKVSADNLRSFLAGGRLNRIV